MTRFVLFVIFLLFAGIFGSLGIPKLLAEHTLMRSATPISATIKSLQPSDGTSSSRKKNNRFRLAIDFAAQLPSGQTVSSQYLDPTLIRTETFRRRSHRDACAAKYPAGAVVQAWYVPAAKLPPAIASRVGSSQDLLYLANRYSEEHVTFAGLSAVLAGIGLAILGNRRSTSATSTKAVPGSDPPVREVRPRHTLWTSAFWRLIGALVAVVPVMGLLLFLSFGAAGDVPQILWWMVAGMAITAGVLLLMALANLSKARAFEQPRLFIENDAMLIGRTNLVAITATSRAAPLQPVLLTLSCVRTQIQGSGKQQQTVRSPEWTQPFSGHDLVTPGTAAGNPGVSSGYSQQDAWQVVIPQHLPPTKKMTAKEPGFEWIVTIKQQTAGKKLEMEFPVLAQQG